MEITVFIFGLVIGSFLNVVIYRIPKGMSIISPPSTCPSCNTKIKPYHNIPLLSWVVLKGKCAYCGGKIPVKYPLVELLSAVISVLVYMKFKTFDIYFFATLFTFLTLLALSVIDLEYKAVPDSLNLLALSLAVFSSSDILENIKNALLLMGGMSAIRYYVSYFVKREAMGEGDIIVGGTMGALLGIKLSLIAIFIASSIAIIPSLYNRFKNNDLELPFVPFLALGTFIVWYFKSEFLEFWRIMYG
ncbi:MAG: prepilin peptidase [Epsilonproteobacteria bacterium]|nr:prepilin peptidase [Campylobacterota bacterium]